MATSLLRDIIISAKQERLVINVHFIGKINVEIYKCVTDDIVTDDVIITDERISHIKERRGQEFYDTYASQFADIIQDPDFIFRDRINTALVCKRFKQDGKYVNVVIRLAVSTDNPAYKNSILTVIGESEKRFQQRLRNNNSLYKKA
ncbi:MAG: hypothetical protein LUG99_20965 [Lachnospiraceae bacterium]|nr:hypothetical protein [Lachnospiraceae bacterium]